MLHTATVETKTLDLLKSLMTLDTLQAHYLAGGTALALQLGHRISIDLDLFGKIAVDDQELISQLNPLGKVSVIAKEPSLLRLEIDKIKVDILNYEHNLLKPILRIDGVRLASIEDIAAMKISAIESRGSKKDFYDLFTLLDHYNLEQILNFNQEKYPEANTLHSLRSITDFEDAELEIDPKSLSGVAWEDVKTRILEEAKKIVL